MTSEAKQVSAQVERMTRRGLTLTLVAFVVTYVICVIIGATGPAVLHRQVLSDNPLVCDGPGCNVTWTHAITDMTPLRQFMFLTAKMAKPAVKDPEGGSPFERFGTDFPLTFRVSAVGVKEDGSEEEIAANRTHTRRVDCPPHGDECRSVVIFAQSHIRYEKYKMAVSFDHPTREFSHRGLEPAVRMTFKMTTANTNYTKFETGWKYFFATCALLLAIAYTLAALGTLRRRKLTFEQRWAAVLLWGLIFFNDPFFLASVYSPSVGWAGLSIFCLVTFLAAILFYWLCELHIITKAADQHTTNTSRVERGGTFFTFKAILLTLFWAFGIGAAMYTLFRLESDPAFSFWDESPDDGEGADSAAAKFMPFAWGLAFFIGGVYLLWFFILFVTACRAYQRLANHMWFTLLLTSVTLLCVIATYFAGVTRAEPQTAVLFLSLYAAVNLYVWFNSFAQLPEDRLWEFDASMRQEPRELGHTGALDEEEDEDDDEMGVMGNGDADVDMGDLEMPGRQRRGGSGSGGGAPAFVIEDESDDDEHDGHPQDRRRGDEAFV